MRHSIIEAISQIKIWSILPAALDRMIAQAHSLDRKPRASIADSVKKQIDDRANAEFFYGQRLGRTGLLGMHGVILPRRSVVTDFYGGTGLDQLSSDLDRMVGDPEIDTIVMDIDSPGGSVEGLQEASEKIYQSRNKKQIVGVANFMAASAAYYLGSSATRLVVAPSGEVGSIGTVMLHLDHSRMLQELGVKPTYIHAGKFKVEGNPYEPLSDEARAEFQRIVDHYYGQFLFDVGRNRGITAEQVKSDFGQGRMFMAEESHSHGLTDAVMSLEQVLRETIHNHSQSNHSIGLRRKRMQLHGI